MVKSESHPYACFYLNHFLHVEKLTGNQINERIFQMEEWLSKTVVRNGESNYKWIDDEWGPAAVGKNCVGYPLGSNPGNIIYFSKYIVFTHEQDLLAFRLRWGING